LEQKAQRDLKLLYLDLAERPEHPFVHFNLGQQLLVMSRPREALAHLEASLRASHATDSIVRKLYALLSQAHQSLGDPSAAEGALCEGLKHCPADAELLFFLGVCRRARGDRAGAIAALERLLTTQQDGQFSSIDAGLRGYKGAHNLAVCYLEDGRWHQAESLWRQVTAQEPGWLDGWAGLAEVCLVQGKRAEAEQALAQLEARGDVTRAQQLRHDHPVQG
jgi:predicted Zn-dependent protease